MLHGDSAHTRFMLQPLRDTMQVPSIPAHWELALKDGTRLCSKMAQHRTEEKEDNRHILRASAPAFLSSARAEMLRPRLQTTYASATTGAFPQSVDVHAGVVPVKH